MSVAENLTPEPLSFDEAVDHARGVRAELLALEAKVGPDVCSALHASLRAVAVRTAKHFGADPIVFAGEPKPHPK